MMTRNINEESYGDKAFSFGGKYRLYENFDKREVDKALEENDVFTQFKQHRKPKSYSPIYVYKKRELFQSDVVFFTRKELVEVNDGYKYLFTTIDVFSKMAWVYPMRENKSANVMKFFEDILRRRHWQ